jgi:hypothetical protein
MIELQQADLQTVLRDYAKGYLPRPGEKFLSPPKVVAVDVGKNVVVFEFCIEKESNENPTIKS